MDRCAECSRSAPGLLVATEFVLGFVKVHETANEQIEPSIVVIVEPDGTGGPTGSRQAGLFGYVRERSISIVVIENAAAVLRDVQIGPAVGIEVSDSDAHAIASGRDASFFRHVCKCPVSIIAVERIAQGRVRGEKVALTAVHQINVYPAVVVVVQEGATCSRCLGQEVIRGAAVLMTPGDSASGRGHFLKERLLSGLCESRWTNQSGAEQRIDAPVYGQASAAGQT